MTFKIEKTGRRDVDEGSVITLLDGVSATGRSTVYPCPFKGKTFTVDSAGATTTVDVSNDATNWTTIGTVTSSTGGFENDKPWAYISANVSSYSSGTVTVTMGV